jgi:hypothetical protein
MRSFRCAKSVLNLTKYRRYCQVAALAKESVEGERKVRPHPTLEDSINFTNILTALLKQKKLWRVCEITL